MTVDPVDPQRRAGEFDRDPAVVGSRPNTSNAVPAQRSLAKLAETPRTRGSCVARRPPRVVSQVRPFTAISRPKRHRWRCGRSVATGTPACRPTPTQRGDAAPSAPRSAPSLGLAMGGRAPLGSGRRENRRRQRAGSTYVRVRRSLHRFHGEAREVEGGALDLDTVACFSRQTSASLSSSRDRFHGAGRKRALRPGPALWELDGNRTLGIFCVRRRTTRLLRRPRDEAALVPQGGLSARVAARTRVRAAISPWPTGLSGQAASWCLPSFAECSVVYPTRWFWYIIERRPSELPK